LHLETRRLTIAGITRHPTEAIRFALHDRDSKFCASFRATLRSGGSPAALAAGA
jgi:hypothetical protein